MRLLQHCGMPAGDVDFIHGDGKVVGGILKDAPARSTLFTGSQAVAEHLVVDLKGKVRGWNCPPVAAAGGACACRCVTAAGLRPVSWQGPEASTAAGALVSKLLAGQRM